MSAASLPDRKALHVATVLFDLADRAQTDANALRRLGTRALTGNYKLGHFVGTLRKYVDAERHEHETVAELMEFAEQSLPEKIVKRNAKTRKESAARSEKLHRKWEKMGLRKRGADVLRIRDFR